MVGGDGERVGGRTCGRAGGNKQGRGPHGVGQQGGLWSPSAPALCMHFMGDHGSLPALQLLQCRGWHSAEKEDLGIHFVAPGSAQIRPGRKRKDVGDLWNVPEGEEWLGPGSYYRAQMKAQGKE